MPLAMPRAGARMLSARGCALCFRKVLQTLPVAPSCFRSKWAPLARQGRLGGQPNIDQSVFSIGATARGPFVIARLISTI